MNRVHRDLRPIRKRHVVAFRLCILGSPFSGRDIFPRTCGAYQERNLIPLLESIRLVGLYPTGWSCRWAPACLCNCRSGQARELPNFLVWSWAPVLARSVIIGPSVVTRRLAAPPNNQHQQGTGDSCLRAALVLVSRSSFAIFDRTAPRRQQQQQWQIVARQFSAKSVERMREYGTVHPGTVVRRYILLRSPRYRCRSLRR
jgi:hypothetical protein